jgi:hypothetical protein
VAVELEHNAARDYAISMALEDESRRALINNDLKRSRNLRTAALRESPGRRSASRSPLKREDVDNTIVKSRLESDIEMTRVQNPRRTFDAKH